MSLTTLALASPTGLAQGQSTYTTRSSFSDAMHNNIHGLAVEATSWQTTGNTPQIRDEVYVYLGVTRVGVEVLRFRMNNGVVSLGRVGLIQTPGEMGSIEILDDPTAPDPSKKLLYVADYNAGFRIFRYPN